MTEQATLTDDPAYQEIEKELVAPPKKAPKSMVMDQYDTLARQVPNEWGHTPKEKKALIKSVHVGVLGKDKQGQLRPVNDLVYFVFQCAQRNLNPFKGQIHAVYIWDSQARQEKLVVITGIGGFRAIAQRSKKPLYAGSSEPEFDYKIDENDPHPASAKVNVFAYNPVTGAREVITTGRAFWEEYAKYKDVYRDGKKTGEKELNSMWASRPHGQLAKCAEAQALRQAFPEELSGVYVQPEIDRLMLAPEATTSAEAKVKRALKAKKNVLEDTPAKPV